MSDMTASQIAEQARRDDLSAAAYQLLVHAIAARRKHLKARLASVEDRNGSAYRAAVASADLAQLAALNREAESLDAECGVLCDLETRVYRLHASAREREDIEAANK
jgi:hypothetical protein